MLRYHIAPQGRKGSIMLDSVKKAIADATRNAQVAGLLEMLNGGRFGKRSLAALAAGIGMSEPDTAALITSSIGDIERTTGRRTGKVYYGL